MFLVLVPEVPPRAISFTTNCSFFIPLFICRFNLDFIQLFKTLQNGWNLTFSYSNMVNTINPHGLIKNFKLFFFNDSHYFT